jgi:peptidoglycan/LPS O-acetylase OafA/YrhL
MTTRNQPLDVLRGMAVFMVLLCHSPNANILKNGWVGVDLFFVLSGFLISGLLFGEIERSGTIDFKRFWIRRGFKIYPSFYVLLSVTALAFLVLSKTVPKQLLGDAFFLQGYFPHVWEHGWSLAVEEHFYFTLPIVLLLLIRCQMIRFVPLLSVAASALCFWLRLVTWNHGHEWQSIFIPTHLRFDALLAGVALGYYAKFDSVSFREAGKKWVIFAGLALVGVGVMLPLVLALTFVYIGFTFIVAWAVNQQPSKNPALKATAWVGTYSYSIYVWHVATSVIFQRFQFSSMIAYLACAVGSGTVMAKIIELPALRLRDRWFPSVRQRSPNCSPLATAGTSAAAQTTAH